MCSIGVGESKYKSDAAEVIQALQDMSAQPTLASQLPYDVGNERICELNYSCPICNQIALDDESRGVFQTAFGATILQGYGICRNCRQIYRIYFRFKSLPAGGLKMEFIRDGEWVYKVAHRPKQNIWIQIVNKICHFFQR